LISRVTSAVLFPYTTLFRSIRRPEGRLLHGPALTTVVQPLAACPDDAVLGVRRQVAWASETTGALGRRRPSSAHYRSSSATDERSEEHTSELQSPDQLVCRL